MSNTSLVPIKIPKLNSSNFGQSIMQAFQNIDLNFQKLANLDVNQGAPGRSCVYVPIHLGAAFVYEAYDVNDTAHSTYCNAFQEWKTWFGELEKKHGDVWRNFLQEVDNAYKQYNEVTGKSKQEYARLACILLWGNPSPFGFGSVPVPGSLTAVLHDHYGNIDGGANVEFPDGEAYKLYGDWLYELYRFNPVGSTTIPETNRGQIREVIREYCRLFSIHFGIVGIGKIVMALSPDMVYGSYHPVGSFEYWYVDPRYRCGVQPSGESTTGDISCILRWVTDTYETGNNVTWDGHFEILEIFPTIRVGDNGEYHWHINGMDTGIPVQGNPGQDGKSTQMLVVERVENVRGWHPTKYPNGQDFWSPKSGPQTFRMLNYSGVPDRVNTQYKSALADNMQMLTRAAATDIPTVDKTIVAGYNRTADYTGRVTQFSISEDKGWLSEKADEQTKNIAEIGYLFRIFRIVGREKFYKYDETPLASVMAIDEYGHDGDPSCDYFYFNRENVSRINDDQPTQELIKSLDGALTIVLPGPAYKHDRTDTAFWFATLRAVKTDVEGVFELVAYCSPHAQQTTQLDEHSQAGMMQSFDAYTHKSTSDNRNKPRGLMLPIGSVLAATSTASDTWAAHVIHSDTGGFVGATGGPDGRRGLQNVNVTNTDNKAFTGGVGRLKDNLGENIGMYNGQFTQVINKRILHVGSVNDFRTLNFVEDCAAGDKYLNGAVPGRKPTGDEGNLIGTAGFFGKMVNRWFVGTELHVDEPVTITRYRDLKAKGRLLDVEGDVVIGPHTHKNIPGIKYRHRAGGLMVASTLTQETLDDPNLVNTNELIFPKGLLTGDVELSFEPFIKSIGDLSWGTENNGNSRNSIWKGKLARFNASRGLRENLKDGDYGVIEGEDIPPVGSTKRDNPFFSGVFDDTIGARIMLATDGFGIYNPMDIGEDGTTINVPFSVDAFGNIQTYGREIRSNADNASWYFHTRWSVDNVTAPGLWFTPPSHNMLNFGTTHEINIETPGSQWYNTRYWETARNSLLDDETPGILDPTEFVSGYCTTLGYMDKNGHATMAFPPGGNNNFATLANYYGAQTLLPTILSVPVDLQYLWGGLVCFGLNPRTFRLKFDNNDYMSRFGGTFRNGLVISEPARTAMIVDGSTNIPYNDYIGDTLKIIYDGNRYLGNETDPCGYKTINMFTVGTGKMDVGVWNKQGMVVEKSMIVGEDLLGYRGASIRGQARAKSFRRHICSYNDTDHKSPIALMFDSGLSSCPAPKHTKGEGCASPDPGFRANDVSPIVFDMGATLGENRLIRFGYAKSVTLRNAEVQTEVSEKEEDLDHKVCLFGKIPEQYATTRTFSYCWDYGTVANRRQIANWSEEMKNAAGGGIVYWGCCHTDNTKEKQTYSNPEAIPGWFVEAVKNSDCTIDGERVNYDPEKAATERVSHVEQGWTGMIYNAFKNRATFNNPKHKKDGDVQRYPFEVGLVEAITSPYMVTVNLYILCLGKWEQAATPGNRCCRGIFGSGMGKAGGTGNRMWRNIPTKLRLPTGVPLPAHSVYASMNASAASCNKNKDGKWKTKGLNGDKPINPGMMWRLGPDGMIWINTSSMGMAMFNQDDGAYLACTTFTYPIDKNSKICDKILPLGALGVDENGVEIDPDNFNPNPDDGNSEEGGNNDDPNVDTEGNWMWDSPAEPTIDTLSVWLDNPLRASLKESLQSFAGKEEVENEDGIKSLEVRSPINDTDVTSGPYGQLSAKIIDNNGTAQVSLWVTSYTSGGSSKLSHRTINFKYDGENISELNSVLLDSHYNPGYYKSADINKVLNCPAGELEYIGTDNNETSTSTWPYIWYTNDGASWTIISAPVVPDNNLYYVLSTTTSLYREYDASGKSILRHAPAGFLLTFNADGSVNTKLGRSNYIKNGTYLDTNGWPESGGISDSNPYGNTKKIIEGLSGVKGVVHAVNGYTNCFTVSKDHWDNNGRYDLHNWHEITMPGASNRMTWNQLSKTTNPINLGWNATALYVDANGNFLRDSNNKLANVPVDPNQQAGVAITHQYTLNQYNNADDSVFRIKNWFAWALNNYLIGSVNNQPWRDRKYAMFTEKSGWSGEWDNLRICREDGQTFVEVGCETNINAPTADSGPNSIPTLKCRMHVDVQIGDSSVYGTAYCVFSGFDRSGGADPNAPTGAKWLCASFNAETAYTAGKFNSPEDAEKLSLPIINDFKACFIVTTLSQVYKVVIDYSGDNKKFEVTELGSGSGDSASYDDSALVSRISALEGKSHDKPGNASSTADGLMSKEDKAKLDGLGTGGDYELPTASSSTKGGIKVGSGLSMTGDTMSVKTVSTTQNGLMTKEDKSTLDDLAGRVAALEAMIIAIQESPLAINLAMPAGDTSVQLNLSGTDVNGNDVNFNVENNSDSDITVS